MKRLQDLFLQALFWALLWVGISACSGGREEHFMTDAAYRAQVQQDFDARMAANGGALASFAVIPTEATPAEQEALQFLYAYMPLADAVDYPTSYYLDQVRASFRTREEMGWKVPEREFRHFVLPIRVNNENLDTSRVAFYRELKPRVQGMSMAEAILEVNHWCHEKMTYQPSDARTSSPLASVCNALGRCGEQSTFCVAALRSVGIPARQVYTPRWAHTDDNHAWVEAWADGQWHFIGACEPEPVLDLGWFNAPASRAMLMHTKVFGRYDGPEEVVLESPNYTEVNLIDNYATTARADFRVVDADGWPVEGARVDFCIYNYAEFYPAVSKYTDADGRTFLSSGLGDLLIWASKDGAYGYAKCSFGKDTEVTVVLDRSLSLSKGRPDSDAFDIVPPPENVKMPAVTPEQRAENDRRFAHEDSLRHAYEATFPTHDEALAFVQEHGYGHHMSTPIEWSRGNWRTIEAFMAQAEDHERVESLFQTLSRKDFHDITLENLMDSYNERDAVIGPRVENEFLSPYKAFFKGYLTPEQRQYVSDPQKLVQVARQYLTVIDDPKAWDIPMSPIGVAKSRLATPRSRGIAFVALARTLGIDAQKNPVNGKIQYRRDGGEWLDVDFDGAGPAVAAPKGSLKLTYTPDKVVDNPKYYSHFSLSKIENGRPRLLEFDEGEVDMGGGVDWAHVFRKGFPLETGRYLLVSGNRLSSGAVPVTMTFFEVVEGKETVLPLVLRSGEGEVPVIGQFDAETKFVPVEAKESASLLSLTGRGYYALALLEPGKEPTNHVLRDLAAAKTQLEAWGRPIVLVCSTEAAMHRLQVEMSEGRYGTLPGTIILGLDQDGAVQKGIEKGMKAGPESAAGQPSRFPLVILADSFNRVFFFSEGYTIGLGEQLAGTVAKL
ncbi:MAG: transglutaminase domain-containing protein [Bacteroidales bacterium]|nr:transglutaminase domain-containing protein [Bacteroidales bacterium]